MKKSAVLSPCRRWRYSLTRDRADWAVPESGYVMFIGLNPSTADETEDDPTIRRCLRFAADWGYTGLVMANLFAWRATDPADMKAAADPVGPDNDQHLVQLARGARVIVAAWGVHGTHMGRDEVVKALPRIAGRLHHLRLTKDGHPGHPLYLPASLVPTPWTDK